MSNFNTTSITLAFCLNALVLSGCNDSGGTSSSSPEAPATESKITVDNVEQIASAAFSSVGAAKRVPVGLGTPASRSSDTSSGEFNYSDFVAKQLSIIQAQKQFTGLGSQSYQVYRASLDCNLHITGELSDELGLAVGDTLNFTLDNCTYGTDVVVNGRINTTLTQVSEDFNGQAPYDVAFDTVISDLNIDVSSVVLDINGDISTHLNENEEGVSTTQLSGNSLNVSVKSISVGNSLALTDYVIDNIENKRTGEYSISPEGTVQISLPLLNLRTHFTTITPFSGVKPGNPTAGELLLTSDTGSQVRIIALPDGENVQIDIDMLGDGHVETIMTTWTRLQNLIPL